MTTTCPALERTMTERAADTIVSEAVPLPALMALCGALEPIRDAAGPADRETVQQAIDWLAFLHGAVAGLESRLLGDMETVPEAALTGAVLQHFGDEPTAYNQGLALARDVRLLCFFRAIARRS
jgi:hypothetical protein